MTAVPGTRARKQWTFFVTWPDAAPEGCPQSCRVWYPTLDAMDLAARVFEMQGAVVTS